MHEFEAQLEQIVTREIDGCERLVECERLSAGASQQTYKLTIEGAGGQKLLAFRRRMAGAEQHASRPDARMEALLLQAARSADVPAPEIFYVLTEKDALGEGFIMQWLDGETLGARIARHQDFAAIRPKLAYQCGQILARIHAIKPQGALADNLSRLSPQDFLQQTYDGYLALGIHQPMIDFTGRWLGDNLPTPQGEALVHNDFRNGNLMVDAKAGIIAVLDWELAHIGDPVRDIGWICTNSWRFGNSDLAVGGFGQLADLLAGYKAVSGRDVAAAHIKFWQVFGSFWWAIHTLGMAASFRQGVDRSVERPAIGRRSSECQIDCVNLLIGGAIAPPPKPEQPPEHLQINDTSGVPADELLESVRDYLRDEIMPNHKGRAGFLARVAANALDMVRREHRLAPLNHAHQHAALMALLESDDSASENNLHHLRGMLCARLRDGTMPLDNQALHAYLRDSVAMQVAIDQPNYSGYQINKTEGKL